MAVTKRTRYEVLARDNNTCRYCRSTENALTIDHVVPTALGGSDNPDNLVAACKDCNAGKSSSQPDATLVAQVSDDTLRWADAVRRAAISVLEGDEELRGRIDTIGQYWEALIPEYRRSQPRYRLPSDWRQTVAGLLAAGLPDSMVLDSMDVAACRTNLDNVFRYMIGVANNKLAKLHEDAAALLEADVPKPRPDAYWDGYTAAVERWSRSYASLQYYAVSKVVDAEGWAWRVAS